ncbi:MAG: hypothetical protein GX646_06450 [Bacteroidales bacterium]|nr:hypothetical protein [Bacteroidales bacterium]
MRRKGSPHLVVIASDPADAHFCNVELRKLKTGAIVGRHYILRSDVQTFVSMYRRDGFSPVEGGNND